MKTKLHFNILLLFSLLIACSLPAISSPEERYDRILAKLERVKDIQTEREKKNWVLTFEHDRLPNLDGTWKLTKKTNKRIGNPILTKPITFVHCTSRLPFEKRDFKEKEVVISSSGPDSFSVMAIYPITDDVYHDPNQKKDIAYQNFGFKGVIRPEDFTYAYTLKLKDYIENPTLSRQLWLNGKLKFKHISGSKIVAKGYEIEYSPECHGFITDEIAFEFEKV